MDIKKGGIYESEHYKIKIRLIKTYEDFNEDFFKAEVLESNNPYCNKGGVIANTIKDLEKNYRSVSNSIEKIT